MKFLHLSDLHIGKSVNGFSMLEEQKHAFEQIFRYIKSEGPAAVVIAGDVYDRAIPGIEAVCVFDDFLTALADRNVAVLLVSGNHDSPERINYASRLLSEKRLYFSGIFGGTIDKVALSDEFGDVNFWLLPFIKPSSVRGLFADKETEDYDDAVKAAIEHSNIDYTARNVLVSHQFYTKSNITPVRSDSELSPVGGLDAVNAGIIGRFDYSALGHLHGRQSVGFEHIHYCGSPVKYSFSECHHEKSVTLVELREKGSLTIKPLCISPIHDMREIKGKLEILINDEVSGLANKEDYLRVILTDEEEIIDPMEKLRSVYPNIMSLGFENSRTAIDIGEIAANISTMEKLSPFDLFDEFFLETQGSVMSAEQSEIVRNILERTCGE